MKKNLIIIMALFATIAFASCGKIFKTEEEKTIFEAEETKYESTELVQAEETKQESTEQESTEPVQAEDVADNSLEQTEETMDTGEINTAPNVEYEDNQVVKKTILMIAPPYDYYLSDKATVKENNSIEWNIKSNKPNDITDNQDWFQDNDLTLNEYQVPNSFLSITGNLPDRVDKIWNNLIITKAFYDNSYIYCTYGSDYSEGYILNIYDKDTFTIIYSLDFTNYKYSPDFIVEDFVYIQQKINWATINNNILYINHCHNTYAKSSKNMNAYLTAIDLSDMSILWRTKALVCNSYNFEMIGDVIISGYGFTDEADYLYQIDRFTGKILGKTQLKSAPSYIIKKDNFLFVRTYHTDYEFEIIQ